MTQSQFYIRPAGDNVGANLVGLGNIIKSGQEKKQRIQEEEQKSKLLQQAKNAVSAAVRSGNPMAIADASIQFPEFRESIESAMGIGGDIRDQQLSDEKMFYQSVLANPGDAEMMAQERVSYLTQQGRDPSQAAELLEELRRGEGEQALQSVETMYALRYPDEFKKFQEATAVEQYQAQTEPGKLIQDWENGVITDDILLDQLETESEEGIETFFTATDESGFPVQVSSETGREYPSPRADQFRADRESMQSGVEQTQEAAAAGARMESSISTTERAIQAIDEILGHEGTESATGPIGSWLNPSRYFGKGRDAKALIDSLKNRVFIETLQSMRQNSPTGGAVGNVSDREGDRLENAVVALDTAQSDEQFIEQLGLLRDILEDSIFNMDIAFRSQFGVPDNSSLNAEDIIRGSN